MSLIEEALRQIQNKDPKAPKTAATAPTPDVSAPPATQPAGKKATRRRSPRPDWSSLAGTLTPWTGFLAIVGGSVLLLVMGLTAGVLVASRTAGPVPMPAAKPSEGAASVSDAAQAERLAVVRRASKRRSIPRQHQPPKLELHGIVEGIGEPFAIVNGRIVRLGESVDGATLVALRDGSARFRWRDRDVTLHTAP